MSENLTDLIDRLRHAGGDYPEVEVKSAAGGLPESLTGSLSALANHPGGGMVILGLGEQSGFRPVSLADPQALKQGARVEGRQLRPTGAAHLPRCGGLT